jgi:hypothetical protein
MTTPDVHRTPGHGFAPETILGMWSVGLFLAFAAAALVFVVTARSGAGTWDEAAFFDNLELTIPLLISAASAVASLVLAIVAMLKRGDRSTAVVLVAAITAMVTLFFTGELLSVVGVLPEH